MHNNFKGMDECVVLWRQSTMRHELTRCMLVKKFLIITKKSIGAYIEKSK